MDVMRSWRSQCAMIICNLLDGASTMTSPMQMDATSNVSRKIAMSRLKGARRITQRALTSIDMLLSQLEELS